MLRLLAASLLVASTSAGTNPATHGPAVATVNSPVNAAARVSARMAPIPAGSYRPLFPAHGGVTHVAAFALDREPVTRRDFLDFVRTHATWRRSAVSRDRAESSYLADWRGDLDAGNGRTLQGPVTNVSWFAASAYCAARGQRLPTTDEWEYVAAASETRRDATRDPAFIDRLLAIYTSHSHGLRNVYGVADLHGAQWEWTADFAGGSHGMPGTSAGHDMAQASAASRYDLNCAGAAMGASDPANYAAFLRSAVRSGLTERTTTSHLGFRCAI